MSCTKPARLVWALCGAYAWFGLTACLVALPPALFSLGVPNHVAVGVLVRASLALLPAEWFGFASVLPWFWILYRSDVERTTASRAVGAVALFILGNGLHVLRPLIQLELTMAVEVPETSGLRHTMSMIYLAVLLGAIAWEERRRRGEKSQLFASAGQT